MPSSNRSFWSRGAPDVELRVRPWSRGGAFAELLRAQLDDDWPTVVAAAGLEDRVEAVPDGGAPAPGRPSDFVHQSAWIASVVELGGHGGSQAFAVRLGEFRRANNDVGRSSGGVAREQPAS